MNKPLLTTVEKEKKKSFIARDVQMRAKLK